MPEGDRAGPRPGSAHASCLLAFDFGTRHVGVAIGNTVSADARPLSVIEHRSNDQLFAAIGLLLEQWQPDRLVVGVPRHPDGAPHEMTGRSERFARQLEGRFARPVARVDERYTSTEADTIEGESRRHRAASGRYGQSGRRAAGRADRNDASAAALILRQYLNESRAEP
jgi:putative Holliday junction resolvase